MDLTEQVKNEIDAQDYQSLLAKWRFAPCYEPLFQGESGEYYKKRMAEMRAKEPDGGYQASKNIGWR